MTSRTRRSPLSAGSEKDLAALTFDRGQERAGRGVAPATSRYARRIGAGVSSATKEKARLRHGAQSAGNLYPLGTGNVVLVSLPDKKAYFDDVGGWSLVSPAPRARPARPHGAVELNPRGDLPPGDARSNGISTAPVAAVSRAAGRASPGRRRARRRAAPLASPPAERPPASLRKKLREPMLVRRL